MASILKVDEIQDISGKKILQNTGGVLQVVNASYSTLVSNTSGSFADTGLSASITPTSSSSKILVLVSQYHRIVSSINNISGDIGNINLLRDSTSIFTTDDLIGVQAACPSGDVVLYHFYNSLVHLDSPATTSEVTYKTQMKLRLTGGTRQIYAQYQNKPSTMTLVEVSA